MKSIGFKLWTGMMTLVVIMLMLLWFFQIVFLESFYLDMQMKSLTDKSHQMVLDIQKLTNIQAIQKDVGLIEQLSSFAYTNNLNVQIQDYSGTILFKSLSSDEQSFNNFFNKLVFEATEKTLQGVLVTEKITHPRFENEFIVLGIPIVFFENRLEGAFVLTAPLAPVSDTASILKKQLTWISLILLVVTFILSLLISNHLSRPIKLISEMTKSIARGNFNVEAISDTHDEIGQLSKDIAEMGKELSHTEQLRKELVGNVSHELRTPLSLIRGYAETLKDVTGGDPHKREKQLNIIIDESVRLSHLIDDILSMSQLDSGTGKLDILSFELEHLLERIRENFADLALKNQIAFEVIGDSCIKLKGDEKKIEQVFYNLVGNAFKYTNESGRIVLEVTNEADLITCAVKDNGRGIDSEELPHVWERYHKGTYGQEGDRTGTGLGLAIVKSILDAHHWTFGIESTVGKGTTVWFKAPRG